MKKVKTNVLRILEQKHIDYETREYDYDDEHLSAVYSFTSWFTGRWNL